MEEGRGSRKLQGGPQGQGTVELRDEMGHSAEENQSSETTLNEKCSLLQAAADVPCKEICLRQ